MASLSFRFCLPFGKVHDLEWRSYTISASVASCVSIMAPRTATCCLCALKRATNSGTSFCNTAQFVRVGWQAPRCFIVFLETQCAIDGSPQHYYAHHITYGKTFTPCLTHVQSQPSQTGDRTSIHVYSRVGKPTACYSFMLCAPVANLNSPGTIMRVPAPSESCQNSTAAQSTTATPRRCPTTQHN